MAKQGYRVMDSDMHVMEPRDLWLTYLDDRFKAYAPTIAPQGEHGRIGWTSQGKALPAFSDHPLRGPLNKARYDQNHPKTKRYAGAKAQGYGAASQLEAMDVEGIDVAVAFRTIGGHVIAIDDMDAELAAALCRAFNRWLADYCARDPKRLKATAVIPLHDVRLGIREAEYAVGTLGHAALTLPTNPVKRRPWYDKAYHPLWETAADLGVPVAFHGIQGAYQEHLSNRYMDSLMMMHAAAHPIEMMLAMGGLIYSGAFDRHPKLKAAFLEATCGWAPWWLWRLDEEQTKLGHADAMKLERKPSDYFAGRCYVACDPDEAGVPAVVQALGADNLVISTDWPHDDSLYPHAIDEFLAMEGLSAEAKRKILWENCARLYGVGQAPA
ncbi:MAG: amidohydrolase [Chloroflexi bacterium]|nr:amidohydrolase [Chloroflexota bacterium]